MYCFVIVLSGVDNHAAVEVGAHLEQVTDFIAVDEYRLSAVRGRNEAKSPTPVDSGSHACSAGLQLLSAWTGVPVHATVTIVLRWILQSPILRPFRLQSLVHPGSRLGSTLHGARAFPYPNRHLCTML